MKKIAIYPGSFDPITFGHLDIAERAAKIFDKVIVAVTSGEIKRPLFSIPERIKLIQSATHRMKNVTTGNFKGLLIDYARTQKATAIIRGLRAVSDFEYEFQMALMNRHLSVKKKHPIETVYLMPDEKYTYLSSTLVKEVSRLQGDIRNFVPKEVEKSLKNKFFKQSLP